MTSDWPSESDASGSVDRRHLDLTTSSKKAEKCQKIAVLSFSNFLRHHPEMFSKNFLVLSINNLEVGSKLLKIPLEGFLKWRVVNPVDKPVEL